MSHRVRRLVASPILRRLSACSAACLVAACLWSAAPAGAAAEVGASAPGQTAYPVVPSGTYRPPVDRPVTDPFRLDNGPYGAGNRGLEYATVVGDRVHAVGAGRVAFAGPVAGRLALTIQHPDGRRSSLTGLQSLEVRAGGLVARGTFVGVALPGLHLGLREGTRYVDPAPFLSGSLRAVLVPVLRG